MTYDRYTYNPAGAGRSDELLRVAVRDGIENGGLEHTLLEPEQHAIEKTSAPEHHYIGAEHYLG